MILFFLNWSLLSNVMVGGDALGSGELNSSKIASPLMLFVRLDACSFLSSISRFSTSLISFWIRINPTCVGVCKWKTISVIKTSIETCQVPLTIDKIAKLFQRGNIKYWLVASSTVIKNTAASLKWRLQKVKFKINCLEVFWRMKSKKTEAKAF